MKAVIVFLIGVCVGYMLAQRPRRPAPVGTWTSSDGTVTVAWMQP